MLLLLVVACVLTACGTTRKGQRTSSSSDSPEEDRPLVYNPATGNYEPVEDPGKLVDTVVWTVMEEEPIGAPEDLLEGKKDVYKMAFLMPFDAGRHAVFHESIDPKMRRFLNYYAGVRMGLDALASDGIRIDAHVFDTEESPQRSVEILRELRDFDVVIGPYDREALATAADWGYQHRTPVISPWTPSISLDDHSPYFVQMLPGLEAHAEAIMKYVGDTFGMPQIYIVTRDEERELARTALFEDIYRRTYPDAGPPERLIIRDTAIDLSTVDMEGIFADAQPNIFVLPYYSRSDEDFINRVLRKLHAERGRHEVYVFGLPQWTNFAGLIPDYLESLSVHVSAVNYVDNALPEVRAFNAKFFERYAAIPEPAAMQGYALTTYLGDALYHYGTRFLESVTATDQTAPFDPQPVFAEGARPEQYNPVRYYENKGIDILRFENQAFHVVD